MVLWKTKTQWAATGSLWISCSHDIYLQITIPMETSTEVLVVISLHAQGSLAPEPRFGGIFWVSKNPALNFTVSSTILHWYLTSKMDLSGVRRASSAGYRLPERNNGTRPITTQPPAERTRRAQGEAPSLELQQDKSDPVKKDHLWKELVWTEKRGVREWWAWLELDSV